MRKSLQLLLVGALVVAGCGRVAESRFNPLNWFGGAQNRELSGTSANPLIPPRSAMSRPEDQDLRLPVARITGLVAEPHPGGAILRVTGVSARQGAYEVGLRQIEGADVPADVLRYALVAYQPAEPVGTEASRSMTAGLGLTTQELEGIRLIEVLGGENAMSIRR